MSDILYLYQFNTQLPGVNIKVKEKIEALAANGVDIKGLILYSDKSTDKKIFDGGLFEKQYFVIENSVKRIFSSRLFSPVNSFLRNLKAIKKLYKEAISSRKFKYIIARYGTSDYSTLWFVKRLEGNIIYESNTNEIEQLKLSYKGIFNSPLWVSYDYWNEKVFGPIVLRKAKGLVCVTKEIENYQRTRIGDHKFPVIKTISNGINVSSFPIAPSLENTGQYNLLMLLGVDVAWNGLDKIAKPILKDNFGIKIYVVGDVRREYESDSIVYCGQLNNEEISKLIISEKIHAGIGTLALERKGITEAAPLKVREYIARGLPVIYNYEDTDLDADLSFREKYFIKIENSPGELNLEIIHKKLKSILSNTDCNLEIRKFAERAVDIKVKAIQYKNLIDEINKLN